MKDRSSVKKIIAILACGIAGCILLAASDWIMIYGDTAYQGTLAWLTDGAAGISSGRNTFALALMFPAIIFYCIGMLGIRNFITDEICRKRYSILTCMGMTPWMSLHLFYVMILYIFSEFSRNGSAGRGIAVCENIFGHFSWIVIVSEIMMIMPFVYLAVLMIRRRTVFSGIMALNNPLLIFAVLKTVTGFLPDVPARLAFLNGLMSESMLIWFGIFIAAVAAGKYTDRH